MHCQLRFLCFLSFGTLSASLWNDVREELSVCCEEFLKTLPYCPFFHWHITLQVPVPFVQPPSPLPSAAFSLSASRFPVVRIPHSAFQFSPPLLTLSPPSSCILDLSRCSQDPPPPPPPKVYTIYQMSSSANGGFAQPINPQPNHTWIHTHTIPFLFDFLLQWFKGICDAFQPDITQPLHIRSDKAPVDKTYFKW